MFRPITLLVIGWLAFGASAAAQSRPDPHMLAQAEAQYLNLDVEQRILYQVLMIAAGHGIAIPSVDFSVRLFKANQSLQAANGMPVTGLFTKETVDKLFEAGVPMLKAYRFQRVEHPVNRVAIWMPTGLGFQSGRTRDGMQWGNDRFQAALNTFDSSNAGALYATLVQKFQAHGDHVVYKVFKNGWFVISVSGSDGTDYYLRYYQYGNSVVGFTATWQNSRGVVFGERIAILMSASLHSTMTGQRFMAPMTFNDPPAVAALPAKPAPAPEPYREAGRPPRDPAPAPSSGKIVSGTGFFVSAEGHFVTNAHVVPACTRGLTVKTSDGRTVQAEIVSKDDANDLALLRVAARPPRVATLRVSARLGEPVAVFGFPHTDMLSTDGNFTVGIITATKGMKDDTRFYQTSAQVQSGNSGGPMLDESANVVGVVVSKLNALKVALSDSSGGDLVQNVNFAVKTSLLATFLDAAGVAFQGPRQDGPRLSSPDLAAHAKSVSGFVVCRG